MPDDGTLEIGATLRVPRGELRFQASRAGGPGGQHVNKASTRVELWWDLAASTAPTDRQRALLSERLATRLDAAGRLRLVEAGSRSQHRNREAVTERFVELLERALRPRKARRKTAVPATERRRRLERKRSRGQVKRLRGKVGPED